MLRLHNNPEFSAPCQCLPVLWFSRYLGLVDSEYFWDDCNGLPRRVVMQQKGTFGHTVFALKEGKKSCEALVLDLDEDVYFSTLSTLSTLPPPSRIHSWFSTPSIDKAQVGGCCKISSSLLLLSSLFLSSPKLPGLTTTSAT